MTSLDPDTQPVARGLNSPMPTRRITALVALVIGLAMTAGQAFADKRIYSYDSATPQTRKLTEGGVTFVFQKSFIATRVLSILETHDIGQADLKPANPEVLGPGGLRAVLGPSAQEHDLYQITDAKDGKPLGRALCHGADRVWLAFGKIKLGRDLRIDAIGRDPVSGKTRLCIALDYQFHGQWALPQAELPQPSREDPFNDAPANRRF